MELIKTKSTLSDGATVWYEYDQEGDLLEVVFKAAEATAAVELTESIILRFDWHTAEPLSLSFISFSRLIQPARYGKAYFQLLTDEWPEEVRQKVWPILQSAPLNEFLELSSYIPHHGRQAVPVAAVKRPMVLATAA